MKCPTCHKNEAEVHPQYGIIACKTCREVDKEIVDRTYEFVPDHIKQERQEYKDHTIQPFRNGQLSKEYLDLYGTKYIKASEDEVKNAKNVWGRDLGEFYKR